MRRVRIERKPRDQMVCKSRWPDRAHWAALAPANKAGEPVQEAFVATVRVPATALNRVRSFICVKDAERLFRILFGFPGNVRACAPFNPRSTEEDSMKKFGYVLAALATIAIAAPSIASAETVVIREGGHRHMGGHMGARAEFRGHRNWHPHRDVVVVRRHRHVY